MELIALADIPNLFAAMTIGLLDNTVIGLNHYLVLGAFVFVCGLLSMMLKRNAIGYASSVVIGVASTAPGYSLAAVLGLIVAIAGVGIHAPGVLVISMAWWRIFGSRVTCGS